jgi:MYXO-CTERM domain-containing protein
MATLFEQHNTSCWGCVEGACPDGISGGKAQIIHDNVIHYTSSSGYVRALYWRTGTGLAYNNVFDYSGRGGDSGSQAITYFELANYRAYGECTTGSTSDIACPSLGAGRIARCCDPSYSAGALSGEGYPCINGLGVGPVGGTPEPVYFWDNKKTADGVTLVDLTSADVVVDETAQWAIALGRDYCVSTSGQPTSCGGYALSYSPYPYPHPLRGEGAGGGGAGSGAGGLGQGGGGSPNAVGGSGPSEEDSCACSTVGSASSSSGQPVGLALLGLGAVVRRRRGGTRAGHRPPVVAAGWTRPWPAALRAPSKRM